MRRPAKLGGAAQAAAVVVGLVSAPAIAIAAEVPIDREAPFSGWCVAPSCALPGARPAALQPPPTLAEGAALGVVEERLRRALAAAVDDAAKKGLGAAYDLAVADAADAVAAALLGDEGRLAKAGGLGAAALRAGLVARLNTTLPAAPGCAGATRLDAIYEGLGVSVALAPLVFPRTRGRVEAACLGTARLAARTIDGAALRALAPEPARRAAADAARALGEAERACVSVGEAATSLARPSTVGGLGERARAARARAAEVTDAACGRALGAIAALPPGPFDALARLGLGGADVGALAAALGEPGGADAALYGRVAAGAATVDDLRELVRSLLTSLPPAGAAPVLANALAALPDAVVVEGGVPTVDPKALLVALGARYGLGEDGAPSLRSLLGLAATPWVLELNGGIPRVDFSQAKVVADLGLGYATKTFGIVGRGWIDTYNLNDSLGHSDYLHTGGELEGFWLSNAFASMLRVEVRLSGGFDYYDTTTYPSGSSATGFYDYDSRIGRGALLVGLRIGAPLDRVSASLLGGGGVQYEDPDTTQLTGGPHSVHFTSDQTVSAHANGRLGVRVRIVPGIVGARLRGELRYFRRTRDELALSGGQVTTTFEVAQQIESHGRLFLDADVASFAGFVPAVFGGVDVLSSKGGAQSKTDVVPLLGVGIVRNTW